MRRDFVIFDVAADIAHFRRQYAVTTALTYPVPPRTALCGLVGAVLGLPKNDSLTDLSDDAAIFGLQIIQPVRTSHVSINLVDTKDNRTFRLKAVNPRTTKRYEVIREPRFRVMFSHLKHGPRLAEALNNGETTYTPCLGLAWMIAWFEDKYRIENGELIGGDTSVQRLISPVRSDDVQGEIRWNHKGLYQRVRMPAEMQPDRSVTRYQSYIIDTTGNAIETTLKNHWRLDDGACFSAL